MILIKFNAPVAQLDRAPDYGSGGCRFESCRVYNFMKIYKLQYTQVIKSDITKVFKFFSNPENLSIITPSKLDFKILTPLPIQMKEGQLIDYTIKLFGIKVRWRTIITEYTPKTKFVDQQLKGPYSMWHHVHQFVDCDDSVKMIDTITYVIPYGFLGSIINKLWVKKDLDMIFEYRRKVVKKYFEGRNNS